MATEIENWVKEETGLGESLSPKTLFNWQLEHIKQQIDYSVANSRFYKEKLGKICFQGEFTSEDFFNLPFTWASDIAKNPLDFLCIPQKRVERVASLLTSGTLCSPKRIFFSEKDILSTRKFFGVGMQFMVKKGDRAVIFLSGQGENGVADILKKALSDIGVDAEIFGSVSDIASAKKAAANADCLVGMPGEMLRFCRKSPLLRPKTLLLAADYIPMAVCRALKEAWKCEVFSNFGMTEAGMGCAVDCRFHKELHLRMADLFFEIIDPISGKPLPIGDMGELVITTLRREAMPLIRYRTGDMAALHSGCTGCKSEILTLKAVYGRCEDYALGDFSGAFGMHALEELLFAKPEITDFVAKKSEEGIFLELEADSSIDMDKLKFQLEYAFPKEKPFFVKIPEKFVSQTGKRKILNI